MGFYDLRCMVSGVSLKGARAVAVGVVGDHVACRPVTLGVRGQYNRGGSVDMVTSEAATQRLVEWFAEGVHDGSVVLDADYRAALGKPPSSVESLLDYFERNVADSSVEAPALTFRRERVFMTLVAAQVWDAIVTSCGREAVTDGQMSEFLSSHTIVGRLYGENPSMYAAQIRELLCIDTFLRARGKGWTFPDDGEFEQHYDSEEVPVYLTQARVTWAAEPNAMGFRCLTGCG